MTAKRIPQLDAIAGASTANDDQLVIFDTSLNTTKRILRSQLAEGIVNDLPYAASGGSSLVGYTQGGSGATARTVQNKLRETVSVKDFGAVGNGIADDTTAINTALTACVSSGAALFFPAGTYLSGRITINSNQKLIGESKATTTIKLKNSANTDLLYGANSDSLFGTNTNAGVNNVTIRDLTLDGNRANNTSGSCIAIYGSALNFYDLNIKNAPHHGIRTDWYEYGEQIFGMEGHFERIVIDSSGRHGWWFQGSHDSVFINVVVVDASQETDNTWDGIRIDFSANGRFIACHVWSRSTTTNIHRYGVAVTNGGNDFSNSHFEGSKTANVLITSEKNQFTNCLFYAAKGGLNIDLRAPSNIIYGTLLDPVSGTPACLGVRMGTSLSENVSICDINLIALGQQAGVIDFTYSNGNNKVTVRGFNNAGTAFVGTVRSSDTVDLLLSGGGGGILQTNRVFDGISGAGSTQVDATALNYWPVQRVSITASGTGVRLPVGQPGTQILIYNAGANTLAVYPAVGGQIDKLGTNTALSLAVDKGVILFASTTLQWNSILSA